MLSDSTDKKKKSHNTRKHQTYVIAADLQRALNLLLTGIQA